MSYFKTEAEVVLTVWVALKKAKQELLIESKKFATQFDGEGVVSSSTSQVSFSGVKLNDYHNRADNILWTSPSLRCGVSRPRTSIKKRPEWTKEQFTVIKQQLADLQLRYESMQWPTPVDQEPLWNSIGTSWGALLFNGLSIFEHGDALFIRTDLSLSNCTEILGSEFDEAMSQRSQRLMASKECA